MYRVISVLEATEWNLIVAIFPIPTTPSPFVSSSGFQAEGHEVLVDCIDLPDILSSTEEESKEVELQLNFKGLTKEMCE